MSDRLRDLRINKVPIFKKAGKASLLKNGDFIFLQVPKCQSSKELWHFNGNITNLLVSIAPTVFHPFRIER